MAFVACLPLPHLYLFVAIVALLPLGKQLALESPFTFMYRCISLRFRDRHNHPREFLEAVKRGKGRVAQPRNACDKARTHLQRSSARRARTGNSASLLELAVAILSTPKASSKYGRTWK